MKLSSGTIEDVMRQVDAVMILSVDGRPPSRGGDAGLFLSQARLYTYQNPWPEACGTESVSSAWAKRSGTPCFSSSDERFTPEMTELKRAPIGRLLGVFTYGPCEIEPHHPDLFWYGIHAVEKCYTLMGTGCETVVRTHTAETDVVTGVWAGGRVATVRGNRNAPHTYGTVEFGTEAIREGKQSPGYRPLVAEIIAFTGRGIAPVAPAETVEILAFMEAADESKRRGGVPVSLAEVIKANGGDDGL